MDREAKVELLNRVLHDTVNSVVQYIDAAQPFVPAGSEEHVATLRRMRDEEAASAHELVDLVAMLDGVPAVGVFPYWNVDLNYLDLRFLARFAAGHEEKAVAFLAEAVESVRDDVRIHRPLARLLGEKRMHLEALRAIGAASQSAS